MQISAYRFGLIAAVGCALCAYPLAQIAAGDGWLPQSLTGYLVSAQYTVMALCMLWVWRASQQGTGISSQQIKPLLLTGVILRLILVPVDSYTSNDIQRYLWDGKVAQSGYDPYRISPSSPEVEALLKNWPTPPEHAKYATVYPPLAISSFAIVTTLGPDWAMFGWKLLVAVINIIVLLMLYRLLVIFEKKQHLALIALSPILVFEVGIAAHVDIFSLLAIVAAVFYWQKQQYAASGTLIGIGVLFKLLPIALLPVIWFTTRQYTLRWRLVAAAVVTIAGGYAIAYSVGWQSLGIVIEFFEKWRFGSPLFQLLDRAFDNVSLTLALFIVAAAGLLLCVVIAPRKPLTAMAGSLSIPLLISPVVFPWYLMALVPFSALLSSATLLIWLTLLPLSYEVLGKFLVNGVWQPADWVLFCVAAGWVIGLGLDWGWNRNKLRNTRPLS